MSDANTHHGIDFTQTKWAWQATYCYLTSGL